MQGPRRNSSPSENIPPCADRADDLRDLRRTVAAWVAARSGPLCRPSRILPCGWLGRFHWQFGYMGYYLTCKIDPNTNLSSFSLDRWLNDYLRSERPADFAPTGPLPSHTVEFHVDGDGERARWRLAPTAGGGALSAAIAGRAPRVALFVG
jgi:hypothetical protein